MQHAGETEQVVSVQMADEYVHLSIRPSLRLQKLLLRSLPTVEEK